MNRKIDLWVEPINVCLTIHNLRIGGVQEYSTVKLPIFKERGSWVSNNLSSSFKGLLRRNYNTILNSSKLGLKKDVIDRLLGNGTQEGKIQISLDYEKTSQNRNKVIILNGIEIDPLLGSVKSGSLFNYEQVSGDINLYFIIEPILPLDKKEAVMLLIGLKSLLYDGIGGFRSKGMGTIKKIDIISDGFLSFTEGEIKKLMEDNS